MRFILVKNVMIELLSQLTVNSIITGSIYALAAIGLSLSYGLLRVLNFSHGHFLMVGSFSFYFLLDNLGLGFVVSSILTFCIGLLLTIVLFHFFIAPFLKYNFLLVVIATLCLNYILESLVQIIFGAQVHTYTDFSTFTSYYFGPVYITPIQILIILSALVFMPLIAIVIHKSSIGRRIRALSENEYAAESLGISKTKYQYGILILAIALAMYAGVLVGFDTSMHHSMGTQFTIKSFAAMLVGGLGNIWGTIFGAYFLGFVENFGVGLEFMGYSIPTGYKDAFAYFFILIVLLFKKEGLFKKNSRRV
jgi:branched-chain amino acid transport system permease protein